MPIRIRKSRHGMTGCPTCGKYIKVADSWMETECPFCGATFRRTTKAPGQRMGRRGSALAAGLLSVGLGAGCLPDSDGDATNNGGNEARGGQQQVLPTAGQPNGGMTGTSAGAEANVAGQAIVADAGMDPPDSAALPPYGIPPQEDMDVPPPPPSDMGVDAATPNDMDAMITPDAQVEGDAALVEDAAIVADAQNTPDMSDDISDAVVVDMDRPAPDAAPLPPYGIPPQPDADAEVPPDPPPQPLYGAPPGGE